MTANTADGLEQEHGAPASKRLRTEVTYPRGSVKRVRVHNFMTYGETVVIEPGARLNLVLGPNGTGKSSLVCALCIGLGGSTKLLGRADNIKDYIKRGTDRGWVEVALSGGPGARDMVVRRDLFKEAEGYRTTWQLNNESVTEKKVTELVASLNIQFDNLCQFLPQDKVVEFARMDAYELLQATEKAIGDAALHEQHQALIALRRQEKSDGVRRAALERDLERLEAQNERLERDVERIRRKRALQARLDTVRKKLLWMRVAEKEAAVQETRAKVEENERLYAERKAELDGNTAPLRELKRQWEASKAAREALVQRNQGLGRRLSDLDRQADQQERVMTELQGKLEALEAQSRQRLADLQHKQRRLEEARAALAALPAMVDRTAEIHAKVQEMLECDQLRREVQEEQSSLADNMTRVLAEKLQQEARKRMLDSLRFQRVQALGRHFNGMHGLMSAVEWVNEVRSKGGLRGEVYGPLAVEMTVRDPSAAAYLEMAVGRRLTQWVTDNEDDLQLLMEQFRRMQLPVSVLCVTNAARSGGYPGSDAARYSQYGIIGTLDEVYDAPPLIKAALRDTCQLHRSYVMGVHDDQRVQQLLDQTEVRTVYTPSNRISRCVSAYNRDPSAATDETRGVSQAAVLADGAGKDVDEERARIASRLQQLQQLHEQAAAAAAAAAAKREALDAKLALLSDQKLALQTEQRQAVTMRNNEVGRVRQLEAVLLQLQQSPDPLVQRPQLAADMQAAAAARADAIIAMAQHVRCMWELQSETVVVDLTYRELDMQVKARSAMSEERERELARFKQRRDALKQLLRTDQKAAEEMRRRAQAECPSTAELRASFADLPDDKTELQEEADKLDAEAHGITLTNTGALEEYTSRQHQIQGLKEQLENADLAQQQLGSEIETLKGQWQPRLQQTVDAINTSFSTNFARIGCAGEVVLATHDDFDKYAIQVKVKFREAEELQVLTAHRQSGGERSVATILYLIALQGVTVTPFRVVDEINQGMDPVNERKVFMQLVKASCQEGTPQCFLLTPKLLPDLPFTRDITVLNIFNGPHIEASVATRFSTEKLYGSRLQGALAQVATGAG